MDAPMADPIETSDPSDSIKRHDVLRQGLIVALSAAGVGAAVEIPSEGDADSMIHLNVTSSGTLGVTAKKEKFPTVAHSKATNPQQVSIVIVEANAPPATGYKEITNGLANGTYNQSAYFKIANPNLHSHPDPDKTPDPEDSAVPFSSTTTLWIAVAWHD
jgi:hypothetical protein